MLAGGETEPEATRAALEAAALAKTSTPTWRRCAATPAMTATAAWMRLSALKTAAEIPGSGFIGFVFCAHVGWVRKRSLSYENLSSKVRL